MMRQSNQEWTNSDDITTNFTWFIFEYFIIHLFIYLFIYLSIYFFTSLVISLQDKGLQKAYHLIMKSQHENYMFVISKLV